MELRFFDEPKEFLDVTGDYLARQPVVSTVVATVAERILRERTAGIPWPARVPCWFVAVLGAAMRTAPFGAYPLFLLPMPEDAARELAHVVLEGGEARRATTGGGQAASRPARRGGTGDAVVRRVHGRRRRAGRTA